MLSDDLDAFAERLFSDPTVTAWTPDIQGELMDMIRQPALDVWGQVIPANDRRVAIDNLYRCTPKGWCQAEQTLMPKAAGQPPQGAVASYTMWDQPAGQAYLGMSAEIGTLHIYKTLALAKTAALARTWAVIFRRAGL